MKKTKYPPVVIEWNDANSWSGWQNDTAELTLAPIVSLGFKLREDKKSITIVQSLDQQLSDAFKVHAMLIIPKGWIKSIKGIK